MEDTWKAAIEEKAKERGRTERNTCFRGGKKGLCGFRQHI